MEDEVGRLTAAVAGGAGTVLIAAVNLLFRRAAVRAVASGLVVVAVAAGAGAVADDPAAAGTAAGVMAVGVLVGSGWLAGAVRRPAVRWALLGLAGAALAGGAVVVFDAGEDDRIDREQDELRATAAAPPVLRRAPVAAATDRGTPVALLVADESWSAVGLAAAEDQTLLTRRGGMIRRGPADGQSNCHGWVFAGGSYWVPPEAVGPILAENGYRPVAGPRPGDLAVYRRDGAAAHTAVVRYTAPDRPPLVEGKWGTAGVYLHLADESVYGPEVTFYRSPRAGHTLAGLGGPGPEDDDDSAGPSGP